MFEQIQAALTQLRSSWRYRWRSIVVMWGVAVLGWAAVFAIPSQYESSARVFVDTNTLLRPLLEGIAVTPNAGSQTDLVRRALLGRPQLEAVIAKTDLNKRVRNAREREDLVRDLMKEIRITGDSSSPQSREANIYSIAYMDTDRKLAYTVVSTLLDSFVQQSVGANRNDADAAQRFLRDQIGDYERRLTESETRLAEFQKKNIGSMPDERGGYFQRLQSEMTALDQLRGQLTVAQHQRDELRSKLLGGSATGSAAGSTPSILETSVDGRIKEATTRLEEMLLRFTDQHPDVIALRETLVRLEEQRNAEIASIRANQGALGAPRASTSLVAQNLQIALNQAEVQLASLDAQVNHRSQNVAELREHINTLPEVEAELLRLNRDYNVTKTEYERLLQRLESARLSDAADRVDEVRFKVIDPPIEPISPVKPKRVLLLIGVLFAALGAGVAFAWFLSQLHPVFVSPRELSRFKDIPVLGTVGAMIDDAAQAATRRKSFGLATAIVFLMISGALLIVFHPSIEHLTHRLLSGDANV